MSNTSLRAEPWYATDILSDIYPIYYLGIAGLAPFGAPDVVNIPVNPTLSGSSDSLNIFSGNQSVYQGGIKAPINECNNSYPIIYRMEHDNMCYFYNPTYNDYSEIYIASIFVPGTNPYAPGCSCLATAAMAGTTLADNIPTIRAFRDKVLKQDYNGRLLISLYYENSPEIVKIMFEHPEVLKQARALIAEYLPIVKAAVNANGKLPPGLANKVLTQDQINSSFMFIDLIHQYAGPRLREVLDYLKAMLQEYANLPLGLGIKILIHGAPMPSNAKGKANGIYNRLPQWLR